MPLLQLNLQEMKIEPHTQETTAELIHNQEVSKTDQIIPELD